MLRRWSHGGWKKAVSISQVLMVRSFVFNAAGFRLFFFSLQPASSASKLPQSILGYGGRVSLNT
jgi:hypothetical protein